jgi:hypothetical protein
MLRCDDSKIKARKARRSVEYSFAQVNLLLPQRAIYLTHNNRLTAAQRME